MMRQRMMRLCLMRPWQWGAAPAAKMRLPRDILGQMKPVVSAPIRPRLGSGGVR
jgi:hypothetical protein